MRKFSKVGVMHMLRSTSLLLVLFMSAHTAVADDAGSPPSQAVAAGYSQHTFSTRHFDRSNVDLGSTYSGGFQWYLTNYFGNMTPASALKIGADGILTTLNPQDASNDSVASIAASKDPPYFVGTAFGCGAYVTADISFDADSVDNQHGFPSWWAMSAEHLLSLKDQQWPNQPPDFQHFGEVDIFEFNRNQNDFPFSYGASLHDWYGVYNKTCGGPNGGFCSVNTSFARGTVSLPLFTNFSEFHSVGMLWTPATEKNNGQISFFFDQRKVGPSVSWSWIANKTPPPPPVDPWKFEIIDSQHLALILGSGSSALNVRSVDVWQNTTACNLSN